MSIFRFTLLIFVFNLLIFGNGPAMIPFLEEELVENEGILSIDQLLYAFAIARITPGQANAYVASIGYFLYGIAGAVLATLAIQLPGYLMLPFIKLYERLQSATWINHFTRGLTVASVGLIFAAALSIGTNTLTGPVTWIVFATALVMLVVFKWNQILTLFAAGLLGIILQLILS